MDDFNNPVFTPIENPNTKPEPEPAPAKPRTSKTRRKQTPKKQAINFPTAAEFASIFKGVVDKSSSDLDAVIDRADENGIAFVRDSDGEVVMYAMSPTVYDDLVNASKKG